MTQRLGNVALDDKQSGARILFRNVILLANYHLNVNNVKHRRKRYPYPKPCFNFLEASM